MDSVPHFRQNLPRTESSLFRIDVGPKGRGLFAEKEIPPRTILHIAPCILVPENEYDSHMKYTILEHYLFNDKSSRNKLFALGYGSLFNHANSPNVDYRIDSNLLQITYISGYRTIDKDAELCISYGSDLWFENAEGQKNCGEDSSESDASGPDAMSGFLGRMEI